VVRAELQPLHPPLELDGELLEYEVDEAVFRGGRRRQRLPAGELRRASSLAELIGRAFASRGERLPDGGRALSAGELGLILLGPDADPLAMGPLLLELQRMELERCDDGRLVWHPRASRHTQLGEATRLSAFAAGPAGERVRSRVRPHVVRMHLRRWSHKEQGTWQERARSYPADLHRYHADGLRRPELPEGFTYVIAHKRGRTGGTGRS
jgi:hypothetical protein